MGDWTLPEPAAGGGTCCDPQLNMAMGLVSGQVGVNKFGRSTNVDAELTDIHDGANASDDVAVWVAPTTARTHQIVSTTTTDDSEQGGARTIRIYGITDWEEGTEVSEDIIMNGQSNVATSNQYVIIHRMKVLTKGGTNVNTGVITATADNDTTVTAQINVGEGQTQMAIYGIPTTQTAYVTQCYASFNKSGGSTGSVDVSMLYNPEPDAELTNFLIKHTHGLITTGTSWMGHIFNPYYKFTGPGIIKMAAFGSTTNLDVSAGFDLILVDN